MWKCVGLRSHSHRMPVIISPSCTNWPFSMQQLRPHNYAKSAMTHFFLFWRSSPSHTVRFRRFKMIKLNYFDSCISCELLTMTTMTIKLNNGIAFHWNLWIILSEWAIGYRSSFLVRRDFLRSKFIWSRISGLDDNDSVNCKLITLRNRCRTRKLVQKTMHMTMKIISSRNCVCFNC